MADLTDPVVRMITKARVSLLFGSPFFGNLATSLDIVDASKWCNSIATDGKNLYYNREFIKKLEDKELLFILGHQVLHCVYDHLGRRGGRDKKIWDAATDYVVNYTLVSENLGKAPKGIMYDPKFDDSMTSEEIYRILEKNSTKVDIPLDEHMDLAGDDPGDGTGGNASVTVLGGPDGPPKLTEADMQSIRNQIKSNIISTAQTVGAGNVPAGVLRLIDEFTTPIMDWRELLEAHVKSAVKDDYTFHRPSRRSWSPDGETLASVIMPGQNIMDAVEVAISIDTSGSMSDEMLRDFLAEVKGIMDTFAEFTLYLWTFDTRVYGFEKFTPANINDIFNYKPQGGGGTMFECNWEFMRNPKSIAPDCDMDELVPHKFVMFTDGYPGGSWGEASYCDTLFVIHGNDKIVSPFGLTAYYQKN